MKVYKFTVKDEEKTSRLCLEETDKGHLKVVPLNDYDRCNDQQLSILVPKRVKPNMKLYRRGKKVNKTEIENLTRSGSDPEFVFRAYRDYISVGQAKKLAKVGKTAIHGLWSLVEDEEDKEPLEALHEALDATTGTEIVEHLSECDTSLLDSIANVFLGVIDFFSR